MFTIYFLLVSNVLYFTTDSHRMKAELTKCWQLHVPWVWLVPLLLLLGVSYGVMGFRGVVGVIWEWLVPLLLLLGVSYGV